MLSFQASPILFRPRRFLTDDAKPGRRPGRSILCLYVRTRARPGDKVRRKKCPAGVVKIPLDLCPVF